MNQNEDDIVEEFEDKIFELQKEIRGLERKIEKYERNSPFTKDGKYIERGSFVYVVHEGIVKRIFVTRIEVFCNWFALEPPYQIYQIHGYEPPRGDRISFLSDYCYSSEEELEADLKTCDK